MNISFHGFWPRFFEDEQNNISFFKELFSDLSYNIISSIDDSSILVNSLYGKQEKDSKKLNILYAPEPYYEKDGWDLVIGGLDESKYSNAINIPLIISYIYCGNFLPRLVNKARVTQVPKKFCCMIMSNGKCEERNNLFLNIHNYKHVDSVGQAFNTTGYLLTAPWGSEEFFQFISQYKFILCGENAKIDQYITEKILHGYLSNTIPIYWGSDYSKRIFNPKSYICLEDTSMKDYSKLLEQLISIDNDDTQWLAMANEPVFIEHKMPEELSMEVLKKKVAQRIKKI